ncbi:MAG: sigma-54-dependent Fis family transcriptional regulator, partial [Nitrospinae bacterium]|nr:sigma-54-dependent Fis family transcriptional regulator [Nitrospinota bacterium]
MEACDSPEIRAKRAGLLINLYGEDGIKQACELIGSDNLCRVRYEGWTIKQWIERKRAAIQRHHRKETLEQEHPALKTIVGESQHILDVCAQMMRYAPTTLPILITGETGTGEEVIAGGLHNLSGRARRPFRILDCAAVPETLFESELFGSKKGAFTGAVADRTGLLETADGGTLCVDEIAKLPLNLQGKLLRVIDRGEFYRLGDPKLRHVDVRIISATNQNLQTMAREGNFLEDLYYRLNQVEIPLLPLRDRPEDIPLLAEHFANHFAAQNNALSFSPYDIWRWLWKHLQGVKPEVTREFNVGEVPNAERPTMRLGRGNARELRGKVENAIIEGDLRRLGNYPFIDYFMFFGREGGLHRIVGARSYKPEGIEDADWELAKELCGKAEGSRRLVLGKDMAKLFGMSESTFSRKIAG